MTSSRIRALLIEDNPGYVRLTREALADARGLHVELESVPQLAEGLERLAKGGIDVVLLDLGLPDSSGLETFSRVHEAASAVPIVVLTGLDDDEFAAEAVRQGAQDYLVKRYLDGHLLGRALRYAIERKQLEAQLRQAQKMEVIGQLAAGVAHDLRNPLQGVMSYLDLLKLKVSGQDELESLLRRILDGLLEMDRLAAQLLDLARQGPEHTAATALGPIVEKAWGFVQAQAAKQHVELQQTFSADLPLVRVNPPRSTQALLNLFKNSLDACPEGGTITVQARPHPRNPGMVEVLISDTGTGIPADIRDKVFEPFFTTKASGKGTGLGLALVKNIIAGCGGYVGLVDTPAPGATIGIGLPVATQGEAPGPNGNIIG